MCSAGLWEPPHPHFKAHGSLKKENSLGVSAELIAPAGRLIGVRLNLFQVADIISLIPGITRRLKPLFLSQS